MIRRWERFLFDLSRSQTRLWIAAIAILLAGAATGWLVSTIKPSSPSRLLDRVFAAMPAGAPGFGLDTTDEHFASDAIVSALETELRDPNIALAHVIDAVPSLAGWVDSAGRNHIRALLAARFSPAEADIAIDYLHVLGNGNEAARQRLVGAAQATPPARFANHALAIVALHKPDLPAAIAYLRKECEHPDAAESRRALVGALLEAHDYKALAALEADPRYREFIDTTVQLTVAIAQKDWPRIVRLVPLTQLSAWQPTIIAVAAMACVAWAFFLLHLGEVRRLLSGTMLLCVVGLALGILSTTPTILAVIWQDDILKFSEGTDIAHTLAYCVGGIGAREELCKLLLFLPLAPILARRGDELEALTVAAFVGLGFAVEENGNYFLGSHGAGAAGRFLTANFLHLAWTGLNGLYLVRAIRRGWNGLNEFLYILAITIISHGVYDALLISPAIEGGEFFAMAVLAGVAALFFARAHELRENVRMTFSLTAAFILGVALLAATLVANQMAILGPALGLTIAFPELLGSALLLFIFFREFREQLTA